MFKLQTCFSHSDLLLLTAPPFHLPGSKMLRLLGSFQVLEEATKPDRGASNSADLNTPKNWQNNRRTMLRTLRVSTWSCKS